MSGVQNIQVMIESKTLPREMEAHGRHTLRSQMLRRLGLKFLTLMAGAGRPFCISVHVIETRKPNSDFDLRAVILISEQPIDPENAEAMAVNAETNL